MANVPFPPQASNDDMESDFCDLCGDNPSDKFFVYILPFDDNYVVEAWLCDFCYLYHGEQHMYIAKLVVDRELELMRENLELIKEEIEELRNEQENN